MKLAIVLAAFLVAPLSFAKYELLKIQDGTSAYCESEVDVARNVFQAVYSPKILSQDRATMMVHIDFLSCKATREGFGYSTEANIALKKILSREENYVVTRSAFKLLVTDANSTLLKTEALTEIAPGKYLVSFDISQINGDFEISVTSHIKIVNESRSQIVDEGKETLGSFKVISK